MHKGQSSLDCAVYTYKYWIQPVVIPEQVWETGRQMLAVWNQLVILREAASERLKAGEAVLGEQEKQAIYDELELGLREAAKGSGLNWECREFILDKFKLATLSAITRIRTGAAPQVAGFPRLRTQLRKITIPHRYTGGGVQPSRLFRASPRKSTKRFWMGSVPDKAYLDNARENRRLRYSKGFFGVDGGTMRFKAMVHRPIPDESRVKNVVLIGNHSRQFGWEWAISVVCEVPARPITVDGTGRYCGLDLGWRKFDGYLRIGMLVDNVGKVIELRLPLEMPNRRTRSFNHWIEQDDRPEADRIYESWEDLRAASSRADQSLECLKTELIRTAEPIDLPEHARSLITQLQPVRQAGIMRLLSALQQADAAPELQRRIMAWKETDDKAGRRIQSARLRLIRRRQSLYQNLAAWIASNYDIISWEAGLGIKAMAEERGKGPALRHADRNRQLAAIGEFKTMLQHQARKRSARLIDGEAAYSTITCFTCGARTGGGAALILQCPNGHSFDQDENAARWFLTRISHEVRTDFNLRQQSATALPQIIEVPDHLKSVAA